MFREGDAYRRRMAEAGLPTSPPGVAPRESEGTGTSDPGTPPTAGISSGMNGLSVSGRGTPTSPAGARAVGASPNTIRCARSRPRPPATPEGRADSTPSPLTRASGQASPRPPAGGSSRGRARPAGARAPRRPWAASRRRSRRASAAAEKTALLFQSRRRARRRRCFRRPLPGRRGMTQLMGDGGGWGGKGGGGGMGAAGPPNVRSPYSPPAAAPPLAMCGFLAGGQGPERRLAKRGVGWACRLRV